MKAGMHGEFSSVVKDDEKFFKLYSTSHIGDISASSQDAGNRKNIIDDLDFISILTNNFCIFNTGKEVVIEQRSPQDLYDERNDLGGILNILNSDIPDKNLNPDDVELRTMLAPYLDILKNQQVDAVFRKAFENPETATQMKQFLPDLEDNYTGEGVFNAILKMFKRLNDQDDYKQLRTLVQQGIKINRDRIYDAPNPYNMIEKAYRKLGIVLPETTVPNNYSPDWYNELINEYIKLDMHGYQEDKVIVNKGRKQTFRNTSEDAFHTAFASTCDFYITNDQKNLKKAEAIYEKFKINSLVMTPDKFMNHYREYLHFKGDKFLGMVSAIIQHVEPLFSEDGLKRIYFTSLFLFDYFNKLLVIKDDLVSDKPFFLLTRQKPTNNQFLYQNELSVLINKLLSVLGSDLEQLGGFQPIERAQIKEDQWPGRRWKFNEMQYQLRFEEDHLRIYILFEKHGDSEADQYG